MAVCQGLLTQHWRESQISMTKHVAGLQRKIRCRSIVLEIDCIRIIILRTSQIPYVPSIIVYCLLCGNTWANNTKISIIFLVILVFIPLELKFKKKLKLQKDFIYKDEYPEKFGPRIILFLVQNTLFNEYCPPCSKVLLINWLNGYLMSPCFITRFLDAQVIRTPSRSSRTCPVGKSPCQACIKTRIGIPTSQVSAGCDHVFL